VRTFDEKQLDEGCPRLLREAKNADTIIQSSFQHSKLKTALRLGGGNPVKYSGFLSVSVVLGSDDMER